MPKKSSRQKRREAEDQALRRRRERPDFIDGGRLAGYRRFCMFARIWWVVCPLLFCGTLFSALLLESWTMAWIWLGVLPTPLIVHIVRRGCFEEKLSCPHCDLPSSGRWHDRGGDERFSHIRPRRR